MGLSTNTYTYTTGPQTFSVSFADDFIERDHVAVYRVGDLDGLGAQVYLNFTWNSDAEVLVTDALTNGDEVVVERTVPKDKLLVDLDAPGELTRESLERNARHALHAVHEAIDGRFEFNVIERTEAAAAAAESNAGAAAGAAASAATQAVNASNAAGAAANSASSAAASASSILGLINTSASETTSGHLMRNGDHGWGGTGNSPTLPDIDAMEKPRGAYRTTAASVGTFPSGGSAGALLRVGYDGNDAFELFASNGSSGALHARNENSTGFTPWRRLAYFDEILQFNGRAALVAWKAAGGVAQNGALASDGTSLYYAKSGATAFSDLAGWEPFLDVTLAHWGVVYSSRGAAAANSTKIIAADAYAASVGKDLHLGRGVIFFNGTLTKVASWVGAGRGFWRTQPAAHLGTSARDKPVAPTQLVATGTFAQSHTWAGVSSMLTSGGRRANGSAIGGGASMNDDFYGLLSFMNTDGTLRGFSIAVLQQGDNLTSRGFRLLTDFGGSEGVAGYEDAAEAARADCAVDVGFWHDGNVSPTIEEVDVVGHWNMAGLHIANISLSGDSRQPYFTKVRHSTFMGYVGISVRGSDRYQITAVGSDWIEVDWAGDLAIRAAATWPNARHTSNGSYSDTTAFGANIISVAKVGAAARITFDGALDPSVVAGRDLVPMSFGGGNSHLLFEDVLFCGFQHCNGYMAHDAANVTSPFDYPSSCLQMSGYAAVETTFQDCAVDTIEEVFMHIHDYRYIKFLNQAVEKTPDNRLNSRGFRVIMSPNDDTYAANHAGSTRDVTLDFQTLTPYADMRPQVPVAGLRFSGDNGYCDGVRVVIPMYHGSVNGVGAYIKPSPGDTAGIKKPGYTGGADALVYDDADDTLKTTSPLVRTDREHITSVDGAATAVEFFDGRTVSFSLADDAAASITLSGTNIFAGLAHVTSNSAVGGAGMVQFRAAASSNFTSTFAGTAAIADGPANTALTGTTGSDGLLNLSTTNGVLHVENRTGGTRTIVLSLLL